MKLSARRKIIVPLLFLVLIPVIFISIFFYTNQKRNYVSNLTHMNEVQVDHMMKLTQKHENSDESKAFMLEYIQDLAIRGSFVVEGDRVIYSALSGTRYDETDIINMIEERIELESTILTYQAFNQWQWKVGIIETSAVSFSDIVNLNWVVVGVGVVFLLFTFEAIILITDSFYRPIKILLSGYNDIISGELKSDIQLETEGEMGMLGMAFNEMRRTIAHRTNKAIQMRNMTDDILRSISTGIITTDVDGRIVKYNDAANRMIGIAQSGTETGAYDIQVIKVLVSQIQRTLETGETINEILNFTSAQKNETVYYDITTTIMYDHEQTLTGVICSFNDISQRKRVEERIERLDRMASLGQLSAGLAHEIRNPLSGMKMATQVLYGRLKPYLGQAEDKMFSANMKEIDRLNNLITELLEFSKPKIPRIKPIEPFEILQHTLHFLGRKIKDKRVQVNLAESKALGRVLFDENQLAQVFMNIISNAVDAVECGGVLTVSCNERYLDDINYLELSFSDNGCGIEAAYLPKVFDPFYTTKKAGTGLGLAVVHRLVSANNGDITVASKPGEGTTFTLLMQLDGE